MTDFTEVKSLIEEQGRAWEEFKKVNDQRLENLEKSAATGDQDAKLARLNESMTTFSKQLDEIQKRQNRNLLAGGESKSLSDEAIEHKNAFGMFMRKGIDTGLRDIERKAMNSTSDPDGGYLIDAEMEAAIDRIAGTLGGLSRFVRVVNIGTRSWQKRVKTSGMAMTRVAEGATAGETTEPTYANIEIVVHPAEVEPWVHNETLEDANIDLAADLAMETAIAFSEGENSELITGNGVGRARGIAAYTNVANSSYSWGSVGYIVSGKSAAFASVAPADALVNLVHALKPQYRNGAVMVMADSTLSAVRQLKDGSGSYYLWNPDPAAGFSGSVLGVPVATDDNIAAIGANSYSIAYGNFGRAYALVRRSGTSLIRDNITSKGVTKFNFRRRFGGGVINFEAYKLMKFGTS